MKAAALSFRENPAFNTYDAIQSLGTGEALVSMLDDDGIPCMAQKVMVLPPRCSFGAISDSLRDMKIKESLLYGKYATPYDPDSAYEFLQRRGLEMEAQAAKEAAEKEAAKQAALEEKEAAKQAAAEAKAAEREAAKQAAAKKKVAKSVGSSVAGTVGREVGKSVGKTFGTFGKTLGGNLGATLGRGIIGTLFK